MSNRTQFWLGSVMLAIAVGLLVGGLVMPRASYSQDQAGEGRTLNYALVASTLRGTRPNSQIVYVLDDRNEVLFLFEATGTKGNRAELRDFLDLREYGTEVQKGRARKDEKRDKKHPAP